MYSVSLPCCTNIGKETLVQTIVDKINEGLGGIWRIHMRSCIRENAMQILY